LCFSDNAGIKKDLGVAFRLHERSPASKKHGRFGIGAKFAIICITLLKSIVHVFTRPNNGESLKQLTIDYPKAIVTDRLTISPHGIEAECLPMWDQYAIDSKGKGTVIHLPSDKSIVQEIVSMITSTAVEDNLLFEIGTTYYTALSTGITYQIFVNEKSYNIIPIDRLCWNTVSDKMTVVFRVYHHPDDSSVIRAYYQDPFSNQVGYRLRVNRGKKNNFVVQEYPTDLVSLGQVYVEIAYSSDWLTLLKNELLYCGIAIPEGKGRVKFTEKLGGTEIKRNGRVAKVLPIKKKSSGDFRVRSIHQNTKVRISFEAVDSDQIVVDDSKTMDDVFNTQVNKSELNEDTINKSLWASVCQLRLDFGKQICDRTGPLPSKSVKKLHENSDSDEESSDLDEESSDLDEENSDLDEESSDSDEEPSVTPELVVIIPPKPKPTVMPKPNIAHSTASSNPIIIPKPIVASSSKSDPILPPPTIVPSFVADPTSSPPMKWVSGYYQNTQTCFRNIVQCLQRINITYGPHFNMICDNPESIMVKSGLSADYAALMHIEQMLKEFSNNE